ncbi:hypothetical protein DYL72_15950 [Vibrio anguillarum]|uniref:Uncharacterized protein n=1 Tax=Vibrio anguillarum TaxID=55601 RepID=A0A7U6FSB9_VIBAN|nr:hypothetical protein [Vibrio anguillarum]AZS26396.1 hypothetical protein DYL72_15950 [Vibrio anguillarum]
MSTSNNEVKQTLTAIEAIASNARTHDELQKAVQLACDFGRPLKYDNRLLYGVSLVSALISARFAYLINKYFYFDVTSAMTIALIVLAQSPL